MSRRRGVWASLWAGVLLLAGGCGGEATLEPPTIHYGQAVCDLCGMIVSDERFAAAEVVLRDGRAEGRFFDDTGEIFQLEAPEDAEFAWYVHDMRTLEWIEAGEAVFLRSKELRTPMGLGIAAFASRSEAEAAQADFGGELYTLDELRE